MARAKHIVSCITIQGLGKGERQVECMARRGCSDKDKTCSNSVVTHWGAVNTKSMTLRCTGGKTNSLCKNMAGGGGMVRALHHALAPLLRHVWSTPGEEFPGTKHRDARHGRHAANLFACGCRVVSRAGSVTPAGKYSKRRQQETGVTSLPSR